MTDASVALARGSELVVDVADRQRWAKVVKARCNGGERGRLGQLGSLLIGYYDDAALRFAGKVGTGFKARELDRLAGLLGGLATVESPFTPAPPPFVSRTARWVRPELVAEVTFGEWTDEGILRHPSYIATRDDKDPRDVVRET